MLGTKWQVRLSASSASVAVRENDASYIAVAVTQAVEVYPSSLIRGLKLCIQCWL